MPVAGPFGAARAGEGRTPGATLAILTDDPMAPIDVPHMCRQEGYEVLDNDARRRRRADGAAQADSMRAADSPRGG